MEQNNRPKCPECKKENIKVHVDYNLASVPEMGNVSPEHVSQGKTETFTCKDCGHGWKSTS